MLEFLIVIIGTSVLNLALCLIPDLIGAYEKRRRQLQTDREQAAKLLADTMRYEVERGPHR